MPQEGVLEEMKGDKGVAAKYKAVKVGVNSAVTVFVPSEKLRSLFSQARENAHEYKRLYKLEEQDPSFWQPLDPIRAFANYAATYGFGHHSGDGQKDPAQRLRIAEVTPEYKMRNQRYKHFEEELNSCTNRLDDTDTDKLCFGYGRYTHENDNGTSEWRPVLVNRPDTSSDTVKRSFTVEWMYAFAGADLEKMQKQADLDEDSVVLAPRVPHILGSGTLEHQSLLEQAVDMKAEGLSESEIAAQLNQKLDAKFEMAKEAAGSGPAGQKQNELMKPARITESEVKHFLKKREGEEGNSSSAAATSSSTSPGMQPVGGTPLNSASMASRFSGGLQSMQGMMPSLRGSTPAADPSGGGGVGLGSPAPPSDAMGPPGNMMGGPPSNAMRLDGGTGMRG
jgi:hypothetical protein